MHHVITKIQTTISTTKTTIIQTNIPIKIKTSIIDLSLQSSTQLPTTKVQTEKLNDALTSNIIKEITNIQPINQDICSYQSFLNASCKIGESSPEETYNRIKDELIKTYPSNGEDLLIETNRSDNSSFQVTNTVNEMDAIHEKNTLSVIQLGECEQTLKDENDINDNDTLIILKFGKTIGHTNEKNIQYEIFAPNTHNALDLSICDNTIYVYVPITLDEESQELYDEVKEQYYDLLDIKSEFYNDICTPFYSQKDSDVILNDRIIYYYSKISRDATCPKNCQFLDYFSENNKLKCSCEISKGSINSTEN